MVSSIPPLVDVLGLTNIDNGAVLGANQVKATLLRQCRQLVNRDDGYNSSM